MFPLRHILCCTDLNLQQCRCLCNDMVRLLCFSNIFCCYCYAIMCSYCYAKGASLHCFWHAYGVLLSQGQANSREPIYSTQYSCEKIPADWLAVWEAAAEPALHLPKANPFIPTDFQLLQARMTG